MKRIGSRSQRTIARPVEISGRGFITGGHVRVRFLPADPDVGLVFARVDLPGRPRIPARVELVSGTARRTTLGDGPRSVTLAEHSLAALSGLRIDNCVIELDGPELPGLDGSARGFVAALTGAGVVRQPAVRPVWSVREPLTVSRNGATLAIHPAAGPTLRVTYILDYGDRSPIPPQTRTCEIDPRTFRNRIAHCRTFLLEAEAAALQAQGVGRHLGPADVVVFGPGGPIANPPRGADEPCRHKILDIVGDLALCGVDLAGHVVAYRSGHPLNVELARRLAVGAAEDLSPIKATRAA